MLCDVISCVICISYLNTSIYCHFIKISCHRLFKENQYQILTDGEELSVICPGFK